MTEDPLLDLRTVESVQHIGKLFVTGAVSSQIQKDQARAGAVNVGYIVKSDPSLDVTSKARQGKSIVFIRYRRQ
jgi:hypothetical protein